MEVLINKKLFIHNLKNTCIILGKKILKVQLIKLNLARPMDGFRTITTTAFDFVLVSFFF